MLAIYAAGLQVRTNRADLDSIRAMQPFYQLVGDDWQMGPNEYVLVLSHVAHSVGVICCVVILVGEPGVHYFPNNRNKPFGQDCYDYPGSWSFALHPGC